MDIREKQEKEDEKEWVKRERGRKMFVWECVRLTIPVEKSWEITHTHTRALYLSAQVRYGWTHFSSHVSFTCVLFMNWGAAGGGNDWEPAALPQVILIFIMNVNGWGSAATFGRVNSEKWGFLSWCYYKGERDIKIKYKRAHKAEHVKVHECMCVCVCVTFFYF